MGWVGLLGKIFRSEPVSLHVRVSLRIDPPTITASLSSTDEYFEPQAQIPRET